MLLRPFLKASTISEEGTQSTYNTDLERCKQLDIADCRKPCVVNERLNRCDMPPEQSLSKLPHDIIGYILNPPSDGAGFHLRGNLGVGVDRTMSSIATSNPKERIVAVDDVDRPSVMKRLIRDICDRKFDHETEGATARSLLFPGVNATMFAYTKQLCDDVHSGEQVPFAQQYTNACEVCLYLVLSWFVTTDEDRDEWLRAQDEVGDDNAFIVLALAPQLLGVPYSDVLWKLRSILTKVFLQHHRRIEQLATPPVTIGAWNVLAQPLDNSAAFVRRYGVLSNDSMMDILIKHCIPDVMMQILKIYGPIYELDPTVQPLNGHTIAQFNPYLNAPSIIVTIVEFVYKVADKISVYRESIVLTMFVLRLCDLTSKEIACGLCRKLGRNASSCDGLFTGVRSGGFLELAWSHDKYRHLYPMISEMFQEAFHTRMNQQPTCLDQ